MAFERQPHELGLSVEHPAPGVSVVRPVGEIDMLTAPTFAQAFRDELTTACSLLVVDLAGVEFLGSSGLAALIEARQRAGETATVLLAGAQRPIVARTLRLTRLDQLFAWYPSVSEAVGTVDARAG